MSLSDLYCPFPLRTAEIVQSSEEEMAEWVIAEGLDTMLPAIDQIPDLFRRYHIAYWMAVCLPDVIDHDDRRALYWSVAWAMVIEWQFDQAKGTDQVANSRNLVEPIVAVLYASGIPRERAGDSRLVSSTIRVMHAIERRFGQPWRQMFASEIAKAVECGVVEAVGNMPGSASDLASYLWYRPLSFGVAPYLAMGFSAADVPAEARFRRHGLAEALYRVTALHIGLVNDLGGVTKETAQCDINGNAVLILEDKHGMSRDLAVDTVKTLCDEQIRAYLYLENRLYEVSAIGFPEELDHVRSYCEVLRAMIRGNIAWHATAPRYTHWVEREFAVDGLGKTGRSGARRGVGGR